MCEPGTFGADMGVTEEEFWILWRHRLLDAHGELRANTHIARIMAALNAIREGRADRYFN